MSDHDSIRDFERSLRSLELRPLSEQTVDLIDAACADVKPQRRRPNAWWMLVPVSAAACLLIAGVVLLTSNLESDNRATSTAIKPAPLDTPSAIKPESSPIVKPVITTSIRLANWRIEAPDDAAYTVIDEHKVRLDRGELYFESNQSIDSQPDTQGLTVITPAGDAHAKGTRFYIGTHAEPYSRTTKGMTMKPLTRVLILSGIVSLTNALGTVKGQADDLLAAEPDKAPAKVAAQSNTDFAIDLFKQLSKENAGSNLFFSPYSISNALAMTAEGARGETALEIGRVLRFPDAALRIGGDAQLIPWETSLIHTGFQKINSSLQSDPNDPKVLQTREKLEALRAKLAEAKKATEAVDHLKDWQKHRAMLAQEQKIAKQISELSSTIDQFKLEVANALWGEKTYHIEKSFRDTIAKHYDTDAIAEADFINNSNGERLRINGWVEDKTNDRIKDLIPEGALDSLTRLVLVNAIYFKGDWATSFSEENTQTADFLGADGTKTPAKLMHGYNLEDAQYGAFNGDGSLFKTPETIDFTEKVRGYPEDDGFAIASLPYKGKELSMVLIAPMTADGLDRIEQRLDSAKLEDWLRQLENREVHVKLPKFKLETDYTLGEAGQAATLQKMGMIQAFDANGADFGGINPSAKSEGLHISMVLHKAFLDVNEKGTEATAATAVIWSLKSGEKDRTFTPTFSADRPFLLMIRHNESGAILFMGRVVNPTAE